jgi:hypothetical protein
MEAVKGIQSYEPLAAPTRTLKVITKVITLLDPITRVIKALTLPAVSSGDKRRAKVSAQSGGEPDGTP